MAAPKAAVEAEIAALRVKLEETGPLMRGEAVHAMGMACFQRRVESVHGGKKAVRTT